LVYHIYGIDVNLGYWWRSSSRFGKQKTAGVIPGCSTFGRSIYGTLQDVVRLAGLTGFTVNFASSAQKLNDDRGIARRASLVRTWRELRFPMLAKRKSVQEHAAIVNLDKQGKLGKERDRKAKSWIEG
jgi:hypothetical protein